MSSVKRFLSPEEEDEGKFGTWMVVIFVVLIVVIIVVVMVIKNPFPGMSTETMNPNYNCPNGKLCTCK